MKYIELRELFDDEDKIVFVNNFNSSLKVAFIVGGIGFTFLIFDFFTLNTFQHIAWYIFVFILPLLIFWGAYADFKSELLNKTKFVMRGSIIDKKYDVDIHKSISDEGRLQYEEIYYYYLFFEGKDTPIKVDRGIYHFFEKQDIAMLCKRTENTEEIYRHEKNIT